MVKKQSQEKNSIPLTSFQLVDIRIHEIVAKRCDPKEEKSRPIPISIELSSYEEVENSKEFSSILLFKAGFPLEESPSCTIELSLEGIFETVPDQETINTEELKQFMSSDVMVLIWPYLRQYLHELTNNLRLGMPPLPIIDPRALSNIEINSSE